MQLRIKTYRQMILMLQTIPEYHLDDDITFEIDSDEFIAKSYELFYSDENNDSLDIGHPYLIELVDDND